MDEKWKWTGEEEGYMTRSELKNDISYGMDWPAKPFRGGPDVRQNRESDVPIRSENHSRIC